MPQLATASAISRALPRRPEIWEINGSVNNSLDNTYVAAVLGYGERMCLTFENGLDGHIAASHTVKVSTQRSSGLVARDSGEEGDES